MANGTIGELLFDSVITTGVAFTGGINTLTLNGVSGVGIQMNSGSGAVTTNGTKFKLGGSQTWLNNSANALTVNGTITNSANTTPYTLTINCTGSGGISLNGIISDGGTTGTTAVVINSTGGGTTFLKGANTFTGGLALQSGILEANGASSLGNGTLTLGKAGSTTTNSLYLNGTVPTFAKTVYMLANNTTTFSARAGGAARDFKGILTGSGNIVVTGAAANCILSLSGNNTYTGTTSVTVGGLKAGVASVAGVSGAFGLNSAITMANTASVVRLTDCIL